MKCIVFFVIALQCYLAFGYGYHRHDRNDEYSAGYLDSYPVDQLGPWEPSDSSEQPRYQPRNPYEPREDMSGDETSRTKYTGNMNYVIPGMEWSWMQQFTTTTRRPTTTERSFSGSEFTAACIRSCPVTSEYNPVCGTDNVTYQNPGRLECAQNCGVRVKLNRLSACSAPVIPNKTTTSTTTRSTTTTYTRPTPSTPLTTITSSESSYVNGNGQNNGNNGNSDNSKNVNTGNKGHDEISNSNGNKEINNDGQNGGSSAGNNCNSNVKKPSVEEVMSCTQLCPLSSEYNPVCGTDGITYSNPGRLLCSQYCGIDVKVKKFAPCSSNVATNIYTNCQCPTFTNPPNTESPVTMTTPSFVQPCLEACPTSMAFSPVCGTDNITYQNLDKLNCAKRCGIDVGLQSMSACADAGINVSPLVRPTDPSIPSPQITQECIKQCSVNQKYEPICGTDNITYNNTGHLICARQCGFNVEIKAASACSDYNVPSSTSSTPLKPPVTPHPNGLNFTIPPDVLASIFPEDTKPDGGSDGDEDVDIDKRFKEENNQPYA